MPIDFLSILETSEQLTLLEPAKNKPSELPGRFGRVVRDFERLMQATETVAVVAGGWSVWHHGYVGRVTSDVDVVIPSSAEVPLLSVAPMLGFNVLSVRQGNWPKLEHKETQIQVDLMPEGRYPGIPTRLAPVPIPHPSNYFASADHLEYVPIAGLFELKIGASRAKDISDLIELIKVNQPALEEVRKQLELVHQSYPAVFDDLVKQASNEQDAHSTKTEPPTEN